MILIINYLIYHVRIGILETEKVGNKMIKFVSYKNELNSLNPLNNLKEFFHILH